MNLNKSEEITIKDIFKLYNEFKALLKQHVFKILIAVFIGALLGGSYAFVSKPKFKAQLSFVLNENQSSGFNLSSLAGLTGISSPSISGGINEDKLVFFTTSRYLMGTALLTKAVVNQKNDVLANHFVEIYKLKGIIEQDTSLIGFTGFKNTTTEHLTYQENKVLDLIIKQITDRKMFKLETKKKTGIVAQSAGIIILEFESKNEELSKYFLDYLYSNLDSYYISKSVQRQKRNYDLIKHRADSLLDLMGSKESSGADYMDQNANIAKMVVRVKVERARRDVELLNLMYAEVLKNLEIAKFNLESQAPMLQVIDRPVFPLLMTKKSIILLTLIGAVVGFFLCLGWLLWRNFIGQAANSFNKNDEE